MWKFSHIFLGKGRIADKQECSWKMWKLSIKFTNSRINRLDSTLTTSVLPRTFNRWVMRRRKIFVDRKENSINLKEKKKRVYGKVYRTQNTHKKYLKNRCRRSRRSRRCLFLKAIWENQKYHGHKKLFELRKSSHKFQSK